MANKFLNLTSLATLRDQLTQFFSSKAEVSQVEADTDTYVTNIDYESTLAFDTTQIVSGNASSPILDVGLLDSMILA